jgi:hypothetical protein
MRECCAKASRGESAGGASPERGEGRSMWKLGNRGGVRSALSGEDLDKFRLAGRGPMAIGMLVVGAGAF